MYQKAILQAEEAAPRDAGAFGPCPRLSIVVPAYNEAPNIPCLVQRILAAVADVRSVELIIVDDGSCDGTMEALRRASLEHPQLRYVSLSRNSGHQVALRAGLAEARGDCVVCLDADLQHPPEVIPAMIEQWRAGAHVVNCLRQDNGSASLFKRTTSRGFYGLLSWISGLELRPGSSDFRLLDRKLVEILNRLPESDLFFRGLIPTLGFKVVNIPYEPHARHQGDSKYTLRKMVRLALNGIISTSTRPLRLATYFAFLTALASLSFLAYVLYAYFVLHAGVPGWASTVGVVLVLGTMQLLVLGVVGEYLGQVLRETRRRPAYHVAELGGLGASADALTDGRNSHVE